MSHLIVLRKVNLFVTNKKSNENKGFDRENQNTLVIDGFQGDVECHRILRDSVEEARDQAAWNCRLTSPSGYYQV